MSRINPFSESDVQDVARLHAEVFYKTEVPASSDLQEYYRQVYLCNPWRAEAIPSLVCRGDHGEVVGFLGVIPRPMLVGGSPMRAAIVHTLMVHPGATDPFAAVQLMRMVLAGPQDFSFSDGGNDAGRRFYQSVGGQTALLYSMDWVLPLRPLAFAAGKIREAYGWRPLIAAMKPVIVAGDAVFRKMGGTSWVEPPAEGFAAPIDSKALLEAIQTFGEESWIRSVYDEESVAWLLQRLEENKDRGELEGFVVRGMDNALLGACLLYFHRRRRSVEVLFMASRKDAPTAIFQHVMQRGAALGASAVGGKLEPRFMDVLLNHHALVKKSGWTMIHSRQQKIVEAFQRGDVFLTALDGENWLRSPNDRI